MDHPVLVESGNKWLMDMKDMAITTNKTYAKMLKIPESTAITCVKPSGTVSQLVDSSSGIHPRYAPYYIRRVRGDIKDPLCAKLIEQGVPHEVDVHNPGAYVFSFPMQAPEESVCVKDVSAIEQLEFWLDVDRCWCEHKPSVSIYVKEDEWMEVGAWVWEHMDQMSGVSFFPHDDHVYRQAPYEAITEEVYQKMQSAMPSTLDLTVTEQEDTTTGSQELACAGGACEL